VVLTNGFCEHLNGILDLTLGTSLPMLGETVGAIGKSVGAGGTTVGPIL
jgi:hypothetical protein